MASENRRVDAFDQSPEPELADLLRSLMRAVKLAVRTHVPASIIAFEPTTSLATVAVGAIPVVKVKDATRLPTQMLALTGVPPNAEALLTPIQLTGVPVVLPATTAGKLTFPLVPGDTGELHVHDRSIQAWLLAGAPVDPQLACTHWLKDSTFHPGLKPTAAPTTVDMTATVLDGAAAVKIGAAAVSAIAKATELVALVDTAVVASVAAGTGAPGTTGTLAFTAFQTAWNAGKAAVSATKGKVE